MDIYRTQLFNQVATDLQIADTNWLIDLINFESGFDPKAKNPFSSARGLIQFIDSTARGMGYESSLDLVNKNPTFEDQMLGPVTDYLKKYAPYDNEHSLYMAVFYPAARNYPAEIPFSKIYMDRYGTGWEKRYKAFAKANPGIKTPQDYVDYVKKKPLKRIAVKASLGLTGLGLIYLIYKKFM